MTHPGGRPSEYSQKIADLICELLSDGKSLREICQSDDMPHRATVFRWLGKHQEFSDQYARAKEEQAEALADEIVSIADDSARDVIVTDDGREVVNSEFIARSRLRVDARKWVASKLKPKKYGDKITTEHDVTDKMADLLTEINARTIGPNDKG